MREWVLERVGPEAIKLATVYKDDVGKLSIDKTVRANLLVLAEENPLEVPPEVAEVIQCADDLWASSVAKFSRAAKLADTEDHRVRGAFVFAGGSATGRACVAAETLVCSASGYQPISALAIGEKVLTHTGHFCKVSRVIYKGRQLMFRVKLTSGGWVDCTAEHKILTDKGWKNVEELIRHTQSRNTGQSHEPIYVAAVPYDGRSGTGDAADARNHIGNRARNGTPRTIENPESGELFEIKNGRKQPYVWCKETRRSNFEKWIPISLDWREHLRAGTSLSCDGGAWASNVAPELGNTPYRRGQGKQFVGQLGDCDDDWASIVAPAELSEIVCVGEKGVWDITVEGDASYIAQGLIHHNSSYGLQVHNFPRKCADDPALVRQAMVRGHQIVPTYGTRITDVLKQMLRPALTPSQGKRLVVADWSSIEARVTPWASGEGDAKLDLFRTGEDVYKVNAAATFKVPVKDVTKDQRQIGKVQELACGFAGGVGAFAAMGRAYGLALPEHEAKRMVDGWRKANPWSVRYWQSLEEGYHRAMRNVGKPFKAGLVTYFYDGLHLWYELPSGRILCYPFARFEEGNVTYAKAAWKPAQDAKEWPRARLWKGLACENITQAIANDILRHSLRQLEPLGVVLTVHDEIVIETDDPERVAEEMERVMCTPPNWAGGLPLGAEVTLMDRYGK
jgi:hypothetical protein